MTEEIIKEIKTPYVSYKILKVVGGRSPKTEVTIKVSGAIDELKIIDVELRLNELKQAIDHHFIFIEE